MAPGWDLVRELETARRLLRGLAPDDLAHARFENRGEAGRFLAFLDEHRLGGFVAAELRAQDRRETVPPLLRGGLRSQYLTQWSRTAALFEPMREIHAALAGERIDHLFLKGPLLSLRGYGDVDRRATNDIDLLVPSDAIERATAVLAELGYAPIGQSLPGRGIGRRVTHHSELGRGGTLVELHWSLARHCGVRIPDTLLWRERCAVEIDGCALPGPSLEVSFLALALGLATDIGLGAARLRALFDLERVVAALDDADGWAERFARMRAMGLGDLVPALVDLALGALDARAAHPGCQRALDEAQFRPFAPRDAGPDAWRPLLDALFATPPPAWANKQAIFARLSAPSFACWLWWGASLPWRTAAHRPAASADA